MESKVPSELEQLLVEQTSKVTLPVSSVSGSLNVAVSVGVCEPTTLASADWKNSTLVSGELAKSLTRFKQQPGKDISVVGSPTLVQSLLRENLLDELRLLIHPIVLGSGKRLFAEGDRVPLRLASSRTLSTGVIYAVYESAAK